MMQPLLYVAEQRYRIFCLFPFIGEEQYLSCRHALSGPEFTVYILHQFL